MQRLVHPLSGSVLFIQRPRELAAFLAHQPRVLPLYPRPRPMSRTRRLVCLALLLVLAPLLLLAFVLMGERPRRRPTPAKQTSQPGSHPRLAQTAIPGF